MTRRQDFTKSGPLFCSLILAGVGVSAGDANAQQPAPTQAAPPATREQELQDRIDQLEQRVGELESTTVLSEPETRVR